jgi:3-hydroxybutyryl-CoA dehydrogenase
MQKITVVGGGTMGNGIAHVFAQAGLSLVDSSTLSLERAQATIRKNLDRQVTKSILSDAEANAAFSSIRFAASIEEADPDQKLVVEAIIEDLGIKKNLFSQMDAHFAPNTLLASNTSSISITQLASSTQRAEKVIGMHFMNPVPVMQLVEIIKGYSTSAETTEAVVALCVRLGKTAVASQDFPGFVSNRILMPMINEAVQCLHESVAGVQEIDQIMKLGMGHPMGPLQLADFIGLDVCLNILNVLYQGLKQPRYGACPLLVNMVAAGKLGAKTKEGFYVWGADGKVAYPNPGFANRQAATALLPA